jgi:acetoin utilization protein AcuB
MKRIADYMTRQPWSVQLDDSIGVARQMLAQREIRHLPVLDGDRSVGMVTERELALAADRAGATVEAVMAPAHSVDASASLADVLDAMLSRRWDAVVVTDEAGAVEGIFTAMDAVRLLRDQLVKVKRRAA